MANKTKKIQNIDLKFSFNLSKLKLKGKGCVMSTIIPVGLLSFNI